MEYSDKQTINIRLDRKLWRKVKSRAALDGKTVTQWTIDALKTKLGEKA